MNICLLVDYENIQALDIAKLPDGLHIHIFVGQSQKSLPRDLVVAAQPLGNRVEWITIDGNGPNALDFHIAYYLGSLLERSPKTECLVLSKDTGFDPLIRHLVRKGARCRRLSSQLELLAKGTAPASDPNLTKVLEQLSRIEKKARPRKRKTLASHINNMFQMKLPSAQVTHLIELLFVQGKLTESNGALTYTF
jgi:hypothetical protein